MAIDIPLPSGPAFATGVQTSNALAKQFMQNMFAPAEAAADLAQKREQTRKTGLEADYYAPNILSEIGLRKAQTSAIPSEIQLRQAQIKAAPTEENLRQAQAQLAQEEAAKAKFYRLHPGLYGTPETKLIESLGVMGLMPKTKSPQNALTQPSNVPDQVPSDALPVEQKDLSTSGPFKTGNPVVDTILNSKYQEKQYKQKMTQGFDWVHTPPDAKAYELGVGAALKINPDEFVKRRLQGETIEEMARKKGVSLDDLPSPDFLPTRDNITKLKTRQAALKEMNSLDKFISEGLGNYYPIIHKMSPSQIVDAMRGLNKDKQAKFLAAIGLSGEQANLRLMVAQARTGQKAIEMMMKKSLTNVNPIVPLIDSDVFKQAQELMNKELNEMFNRAAEVYEVAKKDKEPEGNQTKKESKIVSVQAPNGQIIRLPEEGANRLIKDYPDHKIIKE